jgi:hypothetical protein
MKKRDYYTQIRRGNVDCLSTAPDAIKNDMSLAFCAVKRDPRALEYVSAKLQHHYHLVMTAVQRNGLVLQYASSGLRKNKDIVLAATQENGCALQYTSDALKADYHLVLSIVTRCGRALQFANETLLDNREIVLQAVRNDGLALYFTSNRLCNDYEIVLAAVQQYGTALEYASETLKDNEDIVKAALTQKGSALCHASSRLKNDPNLVLLSMCSQEIGFNAASSELKANKQFVLRVLRLLNNNVFNNDATCNTTNTVTPVKRDAHLLKKKSIVMQHVSDELKRDKQVILEAIKYSGTDVFLYRILEHNNYKSKMKRILDDQNRIRHDYETLCISNENKNHVQDASRVPCRLLINNAFSLYSAPFRHVGIELQQDKVFLLEALKYNGFILYHIGFKEFMGLRKDPEILAQAIKSLKHFILIHYLLGDEFVDSNRILMIQLQLQVIPSTRLKPEYAPCFANVSIKTQ